MVVRDPDAKLKKITPTNYKKIQMTLSVVLANEISPYPTVVRVYIVK
tara:strand:- start:590 stop:730 length:141 start_codon:yes stop_codon:yes gene_type:complete